MQRIDRSRIVVPGTTSLLLIVLFFMCGCAIRSQLLEPNIHITNLSGRTIKQILYRECDTTADVWLPLNNGALISSRYEVHVALPVECADLQAIFLDGKIAGTQQNIKKQFPLKWTFR